MSRPPHGRYHDIAVCLSAGTSIQRTADLVGVDRRTVIGHAHALGYRITSTGHAQLIEGRTVNAPTPTPPGAPRRHTLGDALLAVNELRRHDDKKVAKQADRTIDQVRKLMDLVTAYDEKAATRAEVERLEQQLRDAKAKLRKPNDPTPTGEVDAKTVRAWAAANGVDCPNVGRVPKHVVEAYLQAAA